MVTVLGAEVVKELAAKGMGEAQFSQGCLLVSEADGHADFMGASGRSPMADVGLALSTHLFRVSPRPRRVDAGI
jgi:hypothetical protein